MIKRELNQKEIALLGGKEFCKEKCHCMYRCKEGILSLMSVLNCDRPTVVNALMSGTAIETEEYQQRKEMEKALSRTRARNFKKQRQGNKS